MSGGYIELWGSARCTNETLGWDVRSCKMTCSLNMSSF